MAIQSVNVVNTAASPVLARNQDNSARQPFQQVLMSDPQFPTAPQSFVVPAGKCLVVEYVSGYVTMPSGGIVSDLALLTSVGSVTAAHRLPVALMTTGVNDRFITCQLLCAYASPGTTVAFGVGGSGAGPISTILTISGHLVDVP